MKYQLGGDGWREEFQALRGPLGRQWKIRREDGDLSHELLVTRIEEGVFRMTFEGKNYTLTLLPGNRPGQNLRFLFDDGYVELTVQDEFDLLDELVGGGAGDTGSESVVAVMPGIIRKILVAEGDTVELDQPVLILEAMKMENEIRAPRAGRIRRLTAKEGKTVAAGETLIDIDSDPA